ncbi:MAG: GNAT family N-acetyltransferase [Simkaniaceae bacterium]|nr:GNAT family N-acetyltransferase [Simkaniaceae bacterium]
MEQDGIDFDLSENPSQNGVDFLTQKINESTVGYGKAYSFAIFARDRNGNLIGGLNGSVIYHMIYTDQLWVDMQYRKQGVGKQLMERVHSYGKGKKCSLAMVATMSFQAPIFYQKIGYSVEFSKEGFGNAGTYLLLSKKL